MAPIPEMDTIWMDGALVPWADAKVHVLTHALHYGSGVFEGIRATRPSGAPPCFRLTEHLKRLERSAKLYYMPVPYTRRASSTTPPSRCSSPTSSRPATSARSSSAATARWACSRMHAPVQAIIAAWPWGTYLGEEGIKHGVRAKTSSIQSLDHTALARAAKATGQYLNSILAKVEVLNAGYDEADHAHRARPRRRGLGREHLRRAQRRAHDAAAQRRRARGHHPRHRHEPRRRARASSCRSARCRAPTS